MTEPFVEMADGTMVPVEHPRMVYDGVSGEPIGLREEEDVMDTVAAIQHLTDLRRECGEPEFEAITMALDALVERKHIQASERIEPCDDQALDRLANTAEKH